jgi:ankyrin repeat protein
MELVKSLIKLKANINSQNEKGHTVLTKAIKLNHIELLEVLAENESSIDFSLGKRITLSGCRK